MTTDTDAGVKKPVCRLELNTLPLLGPEELTDEECDGLEPLGIDAFKRLQADWQALVHDPPPSLVCLGVLNEPIIVNTPSGLFGFNGGTYSPFREDLFLIWMLRPEATEIGILPFFRIAIAKPTEPVSDYFAYSGPEMAEIIRSCIRGVAPALAELPLEWCPPAKANVILDRMRASLAAYLGYDMHDPALGKHLTAMLVESFG